MPKLERYQWVGVKNGNPRNPRNPRNLRNLGNPRSPRNLGKKCWVGRNGDLFVSLRVYNYVLQPNNYNFINGV